MSRFERGERACVHASLDRIREIHVSGGSDLPAWPKAAPVRCDTHDEAVPGPLLALLGDALSRCPNVYAVIFERLGGTIGDVGASLRKDFQRVRSVAMAARSSISLPRRPPASPLLVDDERSLARMQRALLEALDDSPDEAALRARILEEKAFDPYRSFVNVMDGRALGVASRVTKKYGRRGHT